MKTRITLFSFAALTLTGCAGIRPPPSSLVGNAVTNLESLCAAINTQTVDAARDCAVALQMSYANLAARLLGNKGRNDVALMGLGASGVGVASYGGRSEIIRGLGLIGGLFAGNAAYVDRRKQGLMLLNAASQLQCLASRAQTLYALGEEHQSAMQAMSQQRDRVGQTPAEAKAFAVVHEICKNTDAAAASGGYDAHKNGELKLAATLMVGVQRIDLETTKAYFTGERDAGLALKAFTDSVEAKAKQQNNMTAAADALKSTAQEAQEREANNKTTAAAAASAAERKTDADAVKSALDSTQKLHELIVDLDACVAGGKP